MVDRGGVVVYRGDYMVVWHVGGLVILMAVVAGVVVDLFVVVSGVMVWCVMR